jgi:hypothetical protein
LDERVLSIVDGKIFSCGKPVVMIHFSQMSSLLAKGLDSNLWESTLDENDVCRQSLKIISALTSEYKDKLMAYRSFHFTFSPIKFKSNASLNVYYRMHIRKSILLGKKLDSGALDKLRRRLARIKFFDNSQTFDAINRYFLPETKKLLNYLLFKTLRRTF